MKTFLKSLVAALLLALPVAAQAGNVTVKGSDTMVILGQRWAEEFMKKHAATKVQVTGGGSGTGLAALQNGTTDIAMSSREMKDAEGDKLREMEGELGEIAAQLESLRARIDRQAA